ncbi:M48 family metalloprotease [Hymenobacter rigui]|uniref:Peptidase M48 domain-containing protein n=1 Tax=Hymenobacter rigui TaxID=334424 RepID=A0A428KQH5_9BACT|nr:M48 family metalloprotease [Hymenobacter rigui]RSK48761.1 hypothetical protein EI291_09325 [Hymenobacter rigui]
MIRVLIGVLWLCLQAGTAAAQQTTYTPYYSADTTQAYQLAVAHRTAIQAHLGAAKTGNSEYREHYKRIVRETSSEVYNAIRHSALLDAELNAMVQRVFRQIQQANPQVASARLVLTRNPQANAYAVGNGTVILNVGLLPGLENESQLAFVLCHELAHIQCRHMETSIQERLTTLHSREMRRQVRRIIQAEYNINSRMKDLVMGLSLDGSYHQRRHERQADSLGYVLLKRTTYEAPQAYRALELLDHIDEPVVKEPLELGRYFSCAEFPKTFEAAPARPQSIFTVKTPEKTVLQTTDTLKSHPDCAKRMRYLRELTAGQIAEGTQPVTPEFARLRSISRLEVVQSWFDTDCYDHALFDALQQLRSDPQNAYLRSMVLLSLYELQHYQLDHRFTEVVSNMSEHNPANFNQLLTVLYGLRTTEYKQLSACFAQLAPAPADDEFTLAARYAAAMLAADQPQATALRQQYQARFRAGRFTTLLFPAPAATGRKTR